MFRKWAHGLVVGLLLGSLFVAFPAAQNYVWSSINGIPYGPGLTISPGGAITVGNGGAIRTGTTANDTLLLQAYDVDGAAYTTLFTLTAGNTPTLTALVAAGGADVPSLRFSGMTNSGFYSAASNIIGVSISGTQAYLFNGGAFFNIRSNIASYVMGASDDLWLTREAAATLQLGNDVNGAAIAQTLKAHDGITGTDIAGANLILAGGRGTGAGAPGTLIFQTSTALGSGTTAQTLATRLIISADGSATLGTTAGTGAGSFYAGTYYAGTTVGVDCTNALQVDTVKGIVTSCSNPTPDPLTQDEINQLRGLLAKQ